MVGMCHFADPLWCQENQQFLSLHLLWPPAFFLSKNFTNFLSDGFKFDGSKSILLNFEFVLSQILIRCTFLDPLFCFSKHLDYWPRKIEAVVPPRHQLEDGYLKTGTFRIQKPKDGCDVEMLLSFCCLIFGAFALLWSLLQLSKDGKEVAKNLSSDEQQRESEVDALYIMSCGR